MKITNRQFNKTVNIDRVNNFAYEYIYSVLIDVMNNHHLSTWGCKIKRGWTAIQLTSYNLKKSTDLLVVATPDFYKSIITIKLINKFNESCTYIEIPFDEIKSVKKEGILLKMIDEWVKLALDNSNKLVAEYKKEHNLK